MPFWVSPMENWQSPTKKNQNNSVTKTNSKSRWQEVKHAAQMGADSSDAKMLASRTSKAQLRKVSTAVLPCECEEPAIVANSLVSAPQRAGLSAPYLRIDLVDPVISGDSSKKNDAPLDSARRRAEISARCMTAPFLGQAPKIHSVRSSSAVRPGAKMQAQQSVSMRRTRPTSSTHPSNPLFLQRQCHPSPLTVRSTTPKTPNSIIQTYGSDPTKKRENAIRRVSSQIQTGPPRTHTVVRSMPAGVSGDTAIHTAGLEPTNHNENIGPESIQANNVLSPRSAAPSFWRLPHDMGSPQLQQHVQRQPQQNRSNSQPGVAPLHNTCSAGSILGSTSPRGRTSTSRMAPTISMSSPFGSKPGQNLVLLASTPNQVNANLYPRTSSAPHLSPTHSSPTRLSPKCLSPTRLSPPRFLFTTSPPLQESPTFPTVSTIQTQTGVVSASTTSPQWAMPPFGMRSRPMIVPEELHGQMSSGVPRKARVVSRGRAPHNVPACAAARPLTARTPRALTPGVIVQGISSVNARRSFGGAVSRTSGS